MTRFAFVPNVRRAFPTGWHDTLIKAAIHRDDANAFASACAWLRANSIDDAPFRDHRLLLAVVSRFGERLGADPAYPRLVGLQRMLWARSRIALHAALPALRGLRDAGIEVLLIKGAARLAEGGEAARGRAAYDLDMVVRPEKGVRALDVLAANGWAANKGFSQKYLRQHLHSFRSINFWKGENGDIDLHMRPFHALNGGETDDQAFWSRALPADLAGVSVLIPAPEDRLVLALGVNGLEGYEHSDWLVDSAMLVASGRIAWGLFEDIVARRRLAVPSAIALRYLADELGHEIPGEVLERLTAASVARPLAFWSEFLLARPRYRASRIGNVMRNLARHARRKKEKAIRGRMPDRRLRARYLGTWRGGDLPPTVFEYPFDVPRRCGPAERLQIASVILLPLPGLRRRIEFEINGADGHVCRVRYRKVTKRQASVLIGVEGECELSDHEKRLVLESRPSRHVRSLDDPDRKARYGAVPFHVVSLDLKIVTGQHDGRAGTARKT